MIRKWLAALILGLCAVHVAMADRVERIEPLSWWVGMKDDRLQLMAHGERIAELEPALQYAGVSIESVERVANPNYLFVNLRIAPDAKPGEFAIDFREGRRTIASRSYVLQAREPGSPGLARYARAGEILCGRTFPDADAARAALVEQLRRWTDEMGLARLGGFGITEADVDRVVADSRGSSMKTNPVVLTDAEIGGLVRERL